MAKRSNGEGSIFKTKTGRWRFILSLGAVNGKRKRIYRTFKSKADAVAALHKLRSEISGGTFVEPSRVTVGQLLDRWLASRVSGRCSTATIELYRSMIERILKPRPIHPGGPLLGSLPAQKLRLSLVQMFVDHMGAEAVPTRTQQVALGVLQKAMRHAVKFGDLAGDPTIGVERPRHDPKGIDPFSQAEAQAIIDATKGTRWHALAVLAFTGGMRIGELLGLHWESVDLAGGSIRVQLQAAETSGKVELKKPKTKHSVRTIDIPPAAVRALQSHREILAAEGLQESPLVFPAPAGGIMSRLNFSHRVWGPTLQTLGLKPRGVHHTRHTYATLALKAGVPVHVVSKVLGHAKPSTTLNTYAHVLAGQQEQATTAMAALFA